MATIPIIRKNGTDYDIEDSQARQDVSNLKSAINNIDENGLIPINSAWERGSIDSDGSINTSAVWRLTTSDIIHYDRIIAFTVENNYTAQYATYTSGGTFIERGFITNGKTFPAGTYFRASVYKTNETTSDNPTDYYKKINISSVNACAIKGVYLNINSDNRLAICNNDLDNLPLNQIYGVVPDSGLQNAPTSEAGLYYSVSKNNAPNSTATRYYIAKSGKTYLSMYWGSGWQDWVMIPTSNMVMLADIDTPYQYASYSRLLSNVKKNICMIASASNWDDTPCGRSGYFESRLYTDHYAMQTFISWNPWTKHYRIVDWDDGSIFADWSDTEYVAPMKVLACGDSICAGYRNGNKGFVGDLGLPYKNIGVSNATLSTKVTSVKNIPDQLVDEVSYDPDIIIAEGGINDYIQGAPMGSIPTAPARDDTEAAALDRSTVMGGTGYLFYQMIKKYPKAQRFFVIVHKMRHSVGIYYPTYQNSASTPYTQQDLHDALVAICNVYNVKVIDVYKDGIINTIFPAYVSEVDFDTDHSVTYTDYVNLDGVHPLDFGYREGYAPLIKQAIGIGTVKVAAE